MGLWRETGEFATTISTVGNVSPMPNGYCPC
jgi:hypothetical protein